MRATPPLVSGVIRAGAPLLVAFAAGLVLHGHPRQAQPAGQQPTFRAAANFIQVDVYPTVNGRPVADLTKADFEVLEDGVPQSVATFEHVSVAPSPDAVQVEPRTEAEAREAAADMHNRLFVLFLDTYHATDPTAWHDGRFRMAGSTEKRRPPEKKPLGPRGVDRAIIQFLEESIGPTDLVAPMSPEMDPARMTFTRRPERFADWVSTAWARRFSWDELDPEEESWAMCYPTDSVGDPFSCFTGILEEMVLRRREALTLKALEDTVDALGRVREGRKAVLLVSEGWQLFRQNQRLARALPASSKRGCPEEPPVTPGVFVGPGGKLQVGKDPQYPLSVDHSACDAARLDLAFRDNDREFRRLMDRANRETVSIYPIDPRGLAVFDQPIDARSPAPTDTVGAGTSITDDANSLRSRMDALRNLASATDGFVTETNDLAGGMQRIADDLSEYYLLGYNSTNTRFDGKFRKITVRVKRPGVEVRARRGYVAATEAEMSAVVKAAVPPDPGVAARDAALAMLNAPVVEHALKVAAGYEWRPAGPVIWAVAELGEAAARQADWREGGQAQITLTTGDGRPVATGRGRVSPAGRMFAWSSADTPLEAGEYLVRVAGRGTQAVEDDPGAQVRLNVPARPAEGAVALSTPHLLRRGPFTGAGFVPTADVKFRRAERIRITVSLGVQPAALTGRLLDRRGQPLAVPVTVEAHDESGRPAALAEAALNSLAPGDYLIELALGDGRTTRTVLAAFRIVP
jgi:VWFA-related protein